MTLYRLLASKMSDTEMIAAIESLNLVYAEAQLLVESARS